MHDRKVPSYSMFSFFIFIFLFRSNGKKEHLVRTISVRVMIIISEVPFWSTFSKFFLNNYEGHWQQHLKDTLQLKILRTWINIHINFFLGKYLEMKMGEGALEIISCTKIRACSLKNIAPEHFTYYYILLCLSNKPSF